MTREGDSGAEAPIVWDGATSRASGAPIHAGQVLGSIGIDGGEDGGDGYGEGRRCRAVCGRDQRGG